MTIASYAMADGGTVIVVTGIASTLGGWKSR
jgi:hypothetical protein